MIDGNKEFGYTLECDLCGEAVEDFEEFMEAVQYKKDYDWKSVREGLEWEDRCPECV